MVLWLGCERGVSSNDHLQADVEDIGIGGVAAVLATFQALISNAQAVKLSILHICHIIDVLVPLRSTPTLLSCTPNTPVQAWVP